MKYIISERQYKLLTNIILEEDSHYDRILDLYNEVGLEGMKPDEIEFLKSGGQSELPSKFKKEMSQSQYDDFMSSPQDISINEHNWNEIYELNKIIGSLNYMVEPSFDYEGVGFFLNSFFNLKFRYNEKLIEKLNLIDSEKNPNFPRISIEEMNGKKYIKYMVPKAWLPELNLDDNLQSS